jgi:hypothetical protein
VSWGQTVSDLWGLKFSWLGEWSSCSSGFWHCVHSLADANIFKKHNISIFRAEICFSEMLVCTDESTCCQKPENSTIRVRSYNWNEATSGYTDKWIYNLTIFNITIQTGIICATDRVNNPARKYQKLTQKTVLLLGAGTQHIIIYGLEIVYRQLSIKCNRWSLYFCKDSVSMLHKMYCYGE